MIGPTIPDLEIFMKATTAQMSYILAGRQLGFILGNALGTLFILNKIFLIFLPVTIAIPYMGPGRNHFCLF